MSNLISILIGIVALLCTAVAFIPFLGILNWAIIPLAVIGAGIGQLSASKTGRNLNLIVIIIGAIRLSLGGGII